jgi:cytidylate kinase
MDEEPDESGALIVGIVGPCSAGKTTLAGALREAGFDARHIAQEHSFAPRMWQVIGRAQVLIFLDVTYEVSQARRWLDWQPADWEEQQRRLAHARRHADLYLQTDEMSIEAVREAVLAFLSTQTRERP